MSFNQSKCGLIIIPMFRGFRSKTSQKHIFFTYRLTSTVCKTVARRMIFIYCGGWLSCIQGWRQGGGLEGAIAPLSEHASPRRKVKNYFVGNFWHLQFPEGRILAPSSEESAPLSEISGTTPGCIWLLSAQNSLPY